MRLTISGSVYGAFREYGDIAGRFTELKWGRRVVRLEAEPEAWMALAAWAWCDYESARDDQRPNTARRMLNAATRVESAVKKYVGRRWEALRLRGTR